MENEASFHIIGRVVSTEIIDNVGHLKVTVNGASEQQGCAIREFRHVYIVFHSGLNWIRHVKKGTLVRIKGDMVAVNNQDDKNPPLLQAVARRYTAIHVMDESQIVGFEDAA